MKLGMMEVVVTAGDVQSSSQIVTTNKPTLNVLQAEYSGTRTSITITITIKVI